MSVCLVASLATCSTQTRSTRDDSTSTRVCVENETAAMGDLRVWDADIGGRLFTIQSGSRECRTINDTRTFLNLYAETIGGSMMGPTRSRASIPLDDGRCYEWTVRNNMSDDAILPCDRSPLAMHEEVAGDTWWGFTQCEAMPTSFLNVTPGVVPPERVGMVIAHEANHREFMARYPSCEAWKRAMNDDPQVRIDMEAEAHCVGAMYEFARGEHPSLLIALSEQARWFSWYFWNGDQRKAMAELAKWCKV